MKILGPYLIGYIEQRALCAGGSIELGRDHRLKRHLIKAEIGDLFWLKEPFALYCSRQFGPKNIREVVVGPAGTQPPVRIQHIAHLLKATPMSALRLERPDSRCTLEIMGMSEHSVRCLVHMVQIDEFYKARAA